MARAAEIAREKAALASAEADALEEFGKRRKS